MDKVLISNKISPEIAEIFDDLFAQLGPPKNRILEAAIEVFALLPREIQYVLKSNNKEDRQLCCDLIRGLGLPSRQSEPSRGAKSAKAG